MSEMIQLTDIEHKYCLMIFLFYATQGPIQCYGSKTHYMILATKDHGLLGSVAFMGLIVDYRGSVLVSLLFEYYSRYLILPADAAISFICSWR